MSRCVRLPIATHLWPRSKARQKCLPLMCAAEVLKQLPACYVAEAVDLTQVVVGKIPKRVFVESPR